MNLIQLCIFCFKLCYPPVQNLTQEIEVEINVQTTKKTCKNVFGRSVRTAKKPSKIFSADPFGRLKNIQKYFRQIRSDSRKTCRKPGFSHDPAGRYSKRRAGCQSKRPAWSHSERSFVRSFLRSFVRSFGRFVGSFVRSFIN